MLPTSRRRIGLAVTAAAVLLGGAALWATVRGPDLEGASPPVREALEDCSRTVGPPETACYLEHVRRRARAAGAEAALEMVSELARRNSEVEADGHAFVHAVGMAAYRRAERVHEAFERCTDIFQSGCHHGVIQAHFTALDSVGRRDIRNVCAPYRKGSRDLLRFQCHHGLGHGLTMYYGHDLPRALRGCDALEDETSRSSCYGGAFMENVVHATNPRHPASETGESGERGGTGWAPVDPDDPHHPCSAVHERYRTACYELQTSVMLHLNDGDLGQTVRDCENAPRDQRDDCFESLGRSISIRAYDDLDRAARLCRVGADHLRPFCFQGLAHTMMILGTRPFPDVGLELCRRVPAAERSGRIRCYFGVGRALESRLEAAARRDACRRPPRRIDRAACRIGAGLDDRDVSVLLEGNAGA